MKSDFDGYALEANALTPAGSRLRHRVPITRFFTPEILTMRKLLMLALLIAPLAMAQVNRTVTIEHSTARVDGTPLSLAEIDRVEIECTSTAGGPVITTLVIVPPNTVRQTDPVFTAGEYICRGKTIDNVGQESAWRDSNVFTVEHPCRENPSPETCAAPMPPESVSIAIVPNP